MNKIDTRRLTQLSLLLAVASALHVAEGWLLLPSPVPGARLGLANVITLVVLFIYGAKEAMQLAVLRVIIGSLMGGSFMTLGFYLSLAGAISSATLMALLVYAWKEKVSPLGVSLAGAITHNIAQLLTASILVSHFGVMAYLPILLAFAIPTGFFVGLLGRMVIKYIPKIR
ncbi:MAG: Gx transporter family protein [bacterium]|nr:Gx transporter family protein [bacterium]